MAHSLQPGSTFAGIMIVGDVMTWITFFLVHQHNLRGMFIYRKMLAQLLQN